jgi:membrane-bound lytic murein transglycosylase F
MGRLGARDLVAVIDAFFAEERRAGRLEKVMSAALRPPIDLTRNTLREFGALVDSRLAALQPLFEQASVQTGIDWRLLAALAYQESQWNAAARSPNGALGIMMLMPDTARALGVGDPLDARQSIEAGARYFVKVREQVPSRIPEPDRSWFAIAAYNMGYGHVEDARVITQKLGGDPDSWAEVALNLPKLSEEAWYLQARNGYARGWEAAYTVERVREFAQILEWRTAGRALVSASPETSSAADAVPGKSPAAGSGSPRPAR